MSEAEPDDTADAEPGGARTELVQSLSRGLAVIRAFEGQTRSMTLVRSPRAPICRARSRGGSCTRWSMTVTPRPTDGCSG